MTDDREKEIEAIAHDLNNVLASIAGFAEFLQQDLLPDTPQHKFAMSIHRGGTEALELVAKLLGDSRTGERNNLPHLPLHGPVLVVDDQMDVREMMLVMMERLGLEAEASADGLAAIDMLRERPGHFQLVIADHNMPNLTGSDLALLIEDDFPGLPVILMSGQGHDDLDRLRERTPSIHAVLQKPVDFQLLSKLVRAVD